MRFRLFASAIVLPLLAMTQRPTNPSYLAAMPTPAQVESAVKGADPVDTAARQAGVFWQLRKVIVDIANSQRRPQQQHTPDEQRLIKEYGAAWSRIWQPVQRALANDKPRLFKLEGYTVDDGILNDALTRLGATTVLAEYAKANSTFARWREQNAQAVETLRTRNEAERVQSEAESKKLWADLERFTKPLARCLAAGRPENQCATEALGRDSSFGSLLFASPKMPPGLRLTGTYTGAGGLSLSFYPDTVQVDCGGVNDLAGYAVERNGAQIVVKLNSGAMDPSLPFAGHDLFKNLLPAVAPADRDKWQGQLVNLSARPDGSFGSTRISPTPAGNIDVTGQVVTGTGRSTNGDMVTLYAIRTRTCNLGALKPTASSSPFGSGSTAMAATFNLLADLMSGSRTSSTKMPPPGFRLNGLYVAASGFEVEFHPESAVLSCRNAVIARDYRVALKGAQVLVAIQNGAAPVVLELATDGTLTGSGQVRVDGRVVAGRDAAGALQYKPVTDTCGLGVLTAGK